MTTGTLEKASQKDLEKLFDAARSYSLHLATIPSFEGNEAYRFVPSRSWNTNVIEKAYFQEEILRKAMQMVEESDKINQLALDDARRVEPMKKTRYFVIESTKGTFEGWVVDFDENALKMYKDALRPYEENRIKENRFQKIWNKFTRKQPENKQPPNELQLENYGVRRDILNSECVEIAPIISKFAFNEGIDDGGF